MRSLGRAIVAFVVGGVVFLAAGAVGITAFIAGSDDPVVPVDESLGPWTILVGSSRPPTNLLVAAVLAMVSVAAGALALEAGTVLRRTRNPDREALADQSPILRHEPGFAGPVAVTVLIPAHDEETSLPATLIALREQTRQPERVVVVADNCSDRTAEIAREFGHEAFVTVANDHRKGGALNQALDEVLAGMGPRDVIMVMDADTRIGPRYLEVAAGRFATDPNLDAVGGVFFGEQGHGLVGQFQRNEYIRYSAEIKRRRGRVFVLTGTASVFRAGALRTVAAARGIVIPGRPGQVYDTSALTEDNELTIALKSLGCSMVSPAECTVTTELMPTWRNLWRQRLRWQRGALENIGAYGLTSATARYWGQQIGIAYGTIALCSAILLVVIAAFAADEVVWFPFWLALGAVFLVERVVTVWAGGWRARILAAFVVPEIVFDLYLQAAFVRCLTDITRNQRASWGHVRHATPPKEQP